jgi:hypothetical protein
LEREARAGKVNLYEERRRKREEEREAAERAQEEEIRRAAEERQKREDAEAAKWMGQISVEEAGADADDDAGGGEAAAAARFAAYVRARKMVSVEELATEFRLRSADALERLSALEAAGEVTGVLDERGKFIFISPEEMAAVAAFVRERGRISIAELAARSGEFFCLGGGRFFGGGGCVRWGRGIGCFFLCD